MTTPPINRPDHDREPFLDQATGDAAHPQDSSFTPEECAAAALHNALTPAESMPDAVRTRMTALADSLATQAAPPNAPVRRAGDQPVARIGPARRVLPWLVAAAAIVIVAVSVSTIRERERELAAVRAQIADMQTRIAGNDQLLADARLRTESLTRELTDRSAALTAQEAALAEAARQQMAIATQLADATSRLNERETLLAQAGEKERELSRELNEARLTIAKYEEPVDPAVLAANRTKLMEVPDTVQIAWAPFDLPDAPAEQRAVQGDVIWNDRLQSGFLRFVGLKVNDPKVEQYQVWVIDERGLEQKVSGGIFNATAQGEVIVPIEPGIEVGRVALFAITVEKPGGTWVPDLKRRVVVAPRGG
jgi:hypothetical protein